MNVRVALALSCALGATFLHSKDAALALPDSSAGTSTDVPELSGGPIGLDDLLRRAFEHDPGLVAASAAIRAAEGMRRQVGLYPNPMLGYTTEENPFDSDRDAGKHGAFVEQTIVTGGKLKKSRAVSDREIEQARASSELVRLRSLDRVRRLYYRALVAQRRVELDEKLARLARESADVSAQLFNTGAVDLPERLSAENEAELADLARLDSRRELTSLWRELRAAVGDPTLTPARLADTLEAEPPRLAADATLSTILAGSPELAIAELGIERARLRLDREHASPVPDVEVRAGVLDNREPIAETGRPAGTEWKADIGVRIPLFGRNQGSVAAAEAEIDRASAERDRSRLRVEARFAPVFARYEQEYDRVSRYREGILPRARQAHELYVERHRQMAAAYPQVLSAERVSLEAQRSYAGALGRLWEAVTLLEGMLVGDEAVGSMMENGGRELANGGLAR